MITKADLRYLNYVLKHKYYVMLECFKLGIPWRGIVHDLSKFSKHEWRPYVEKFYGDELVAADEAIRQQERFGRAWLHHQHYNPHHWQHFVQIYNPMSIEGTRHWDVVTFRVFRMPEPLVREMLADWRGMARSKGDPSVHEWYIANESRMILHPSTRKYLKSLMTKDELYGSEVDDG